MNSLEIQAEVAALHWFHRIDLGNGIVTPGDDNTPQKLRAILMPEDLTGLSVLDIGTWDGFFAFEAERRGAARVVASDAYVWSLPGRKRSFDLAKRVLRSNVEERFIAVEDMTPETIGTFDVVLFLGVLYHLPNPFLAIMRLASIAKMIIIESHVDMLDTPGPAMRFYPGATLNNDPTNYWGPNPQCVVDMCKEVGFREIKTIEPENYLPARMVFHVYK